MHQAFKEITSIFKKNKAKSKWDIYMAAHNQYLASVEKLQEIHVVYNQVTEEFKRTAEAQLEIGVRLKELYANFEKALFQWNQNNVNSDKDFETLKYLESAYNKVKHEEFDTANDKNEEVGIRYKYVLSQWNNAKAEVDRCRRVCDEKKSYWEKKNKIPV